MLLLAAACRGAGVACGQRQAQKTLTPKEVYQQAKDSVVHIDVKDGHGNLFTGTGFFVIDDAHVATCYHVIDGAVEIKVTGTSQTFWGVSQVKFNRYRDIAVLTLDKPTHRRPLACGKLSRVGPGDQIFVVGNPLGFLENTLSVGIVSGIRRTEGQTVLQFSAPISHGNSGSPVFDSHGLVLAVARATFAEGQSLNLASDIGGLEHLGETDSWHDFAAKATPSQQEQTATTAAHEVDLEVVRNKYGADIGGCYNALFREDLRCSIALRTLIFETQKGLPRLNSSSKEFFVSLRQGVKAVLDSLNELPAAERPQGAEGDFVEGERVLEVSATEFFQEAASDGQLVLRSSVRLDPKERSDIAERLEAAQRKYRAALDSFNELLYKEYLASTSLFQYANLDKPVTFYVLYSEGFSGAFPDPDIKDKALVGWADPGSPLHIGDEIDGIAASPDDKFTPVSTWDDVWIFLSHVGSTGECYVQLSNREGSIQCQFHKRPIFPYH